MGLMAARVALIARDADGAPSFPASVVDAGGITRVLHDGTWRAIDVGGFAGREFRHPSGLAWVVVRVATLTIPGVGPGAIAVVWLHSSARDSIPAQYAPILSALASAGVVLRSWAITLDADGAMLCTALQSDGTPAATLVKGAWPATWRMYQPGDTPPSIGVAGAPTGPLCVGAVVA